MMDFEKAIKDAFEALQLTNRVETIDVIEKKQLKLQEFPVVWGISTEIFLPDGKAVSINFFIALPTDFPLVIPKIYLSKKDYDWIKYIPHVNIDLNVCLYDEEYITIDSTQPTEIIRLCIQKARRIIEEGLAKTNKENFEEEFTSYWKDSYEMKDKIVPCLSIIPQDVIIVENQIKFWYLQKSFLGYSIILYSENSDANNLKLFLDENKFSAEELQAFYLGEIKELDPPFLLSNKQTYSIVKANFPESEKRFGIFINQNFYPKVVIFSKYINSKRLLYGWQIPPLNTHRNGFRSDKLSPLQVYKNHQQNDIVVRLSFEEFTSNRLQERTDGPGVIHQKYSLTLCGLGSIGSNLLHYLTSEAIELKLIDPDILTIENINRHYLGVEYLNNHKVAALRQALLYKNPLLNVEAFKNSIIKIIRTEPQILNQSDFIFIAIGNTNIESFVLKSLEDGKIKKPIFIFWVEPFLCGGHVLFIHPERPIDLTTLYNRKYYKYNIVDEEEYENTQRKMLFKEAGCQSSFMAYSQRNITLFLCSLIPYIFKIMEDGSKKNFRLTWKGNKNAIENYSFKISESGQLLDFEKVYIQEL